MTTENFIKAGDNVITLTLTEAGSPTALAWTSLTIDVLKARSGENVTSITRTSDGNGVTFSSGVLTINPPDLSEGVASFEAGKLYRVKVRVISPTTPTGAVFGDEDSTDKLYFYVPAA